MNLQGHTHNYTSRYGCVNVPTLKWKRMNTHETAHERRGGVGDNRKTRTTTDHDDDAVEAVRDGGERCR
jgi:hypothetical protein